MNNLHHFSLTSETLNTVKIEVGFKFRVLNELQVNVFMFFES